MYLTSPEDDGHFVGYWAEPEASQTCPETHQFPSISTNVYGNGADLLISPRTTGQGFGGIANNTPTGSLMARSQQTAEQQDDSNPAPAEWLLGSWLPAKGSGARCNDMCTFNPNSTYLISDESFNAPPAAGFLRTLSCS
jgi:hypothetical protein